jgi:leucine dehydrogenase
MIADSVQTKSICELYAEAEHERVVLWSDTTCGYRCVIAIHSTALGPAVGGTRLWNYDCEKIASIDAMRLSTAMSYKNALAGLPFGGGKAVIFKACSEADREQIFRTHGRFVNSLNGIFITAEDIGTRPSDMEFVNKETPFVAGLPGRSGDPSPLTALGVFRSMQACATYRWGSSTLANKKVAIQGCGSTGFNLALKLHAAGAQLIVTDTDRDKLQSMVDATGADAVTPEEIYSVEADIFAPCAFGGVLNYETIPKLKVTIVVGSANNQLWTEEDGDELARLGILYAPDCIANSGGIINGCRELLGWDQTTATDKIDQIYDRTLEIFDLAETQGLAPNRSGVNLARRLLADAQRMKGTPDINAGMSI